MQPAQFRYFSNGSYTPPRKTPSRNFIFPKNTFQKFHFHEKHLAKTTLSRTYISSERAFSRNYTFHVMHLPECLFSLPECRNYISPITYLPEFTLARMYIWPKLYFPENLYARNYICQNVHLAEITFPRKLICHLPECTFGRNYISRQTYFSEITFSPKIHFLETIFYSKNCTTFRLFISNKQNKL